MGNFAVLFECLEDFPTFFPILFIPRRPVRKEERLHSLGADIRGNQTTE